MQELYCELWLRILETTHSLGPARFKEIHLFTTGVAFPIKVPVSMPEAKGHSLHLTNPN